MDDSSPLIQALRNPDVWPDRPEHVELIETHISVVLITREFAWKIRKPVSFGFIDFSTLELRLHYAEEELRLNRRTSPKLYLGLVLITGSVSSPRIGGDGPVMEYAVQMRRFEQDQLLLRMANAGPIASWVMSQLAETLASFHQHVDVANGSSHFGSLDAVRQDAIDNFTTLNSLLPADAPEIPTLTTLHAWTLSELERLGPVIEQRHQSGKVRECHGDLHLANIVMVDQQQFSASRVLLNRYLEVTGDYDGLRVLRFYIVYRAMVRAKVDLLRCRQSADEATACRMRLESSAYLQLAAQNSTPSRPMLIIMHGVSGSGKSHLSSRLVESASIIRIRSDIERKRLSGLEETQRTDGDANRQLYSSARSAQTYQRLLDLAELILNAGHSVVVDAVFMSHEHRQPFRALAERLNVPFLILACEAPVEILRSRVRSRQVENRDASDADLAVLEKQLAADCGLDREHPSDLLRVDTSRESAIEDVLADVCSSLRSSVIP